MKIGRMRPLAWLTCALLLAIASNRSAEAVLVFLRGQDKPVTGILVREDPREVVLREKRPDGTWVERSIPRTDVVDLIQTISRERLAALAIDKPGDYRDYAEELAEKRQDPEAHEAGLRLYLIAAWLDPDKLGKSSLLGMIKLARSPAEERSFRAMAYLLDPAHDKEVLQAPITAAAVESPRKMRDDDRQALIKALRAVRGAPTQSRRGLAKRLNIKALLAPHAEMLTWEEFAAAASGVCAYCKNGRVRCEDCEGTGKLMDDGRRINCAACSGTGTDTCKVCGGQFATAPMPPHLLAKILAVELALLGGESSEPKGPAAAAGGDPPADDKPPGDWSIAVARGRTQPARQLSLETLTEFDPRLCLYRDGKWVAPDGSP